MFQIKDGDCIGGYTTAKWSSPLADERICADEAFLFNLTCQRHFPSKQNGADIFCRFDMGPDFSGKGACGLSAYDSPLTVMGSAGHMQYSLATALV